MKKLITLGIILALFADAFSQYKTLNKVDFIEEEIPYFEFTGLGSNQIFIEMDFGKSIIEDFSFLEKISLDNKIIRIELLYTDYPKGINLINLNNNRLDRLTGIVPNAFSDNSIDWRIVRQVDCKNQTEAKKLNHGFCITYENNFPEYFTRTYGKDKEIYAIVNEEIDVSDSTILKVMDRNPDWQKAVIIADLTGSMSTYAAELMLWLKLQDYNNVKRVVFFNDGDQTPDDKKIIGRTGGIYFSRVDNIDTLINTALQTISAGSGGDDDENDIEAILKTIKKYPNASNYILIADNNANMRDIRLIKSVNKPIKIILCGSENGINPEYLRLAKETGGSIHTIDQDITSIISNCACNDGGYLLNNELYTYSITEDKYIKKNN